MSTVTQSFQTALAMHRDGKIRDALELYEELARHDGLNPQLLHYSGLAHMQLGNLAEAERLMRRSIQLEPTSANALSDFGALKSKQREFEPAIDLLRRALQINEHHTDALKNIAATFNRLKRPSEALPYLERLHRVDPSSADVLARLAHTHLKLNEVDSAIRYFFRAIRQQPDRTRARILLGEALEAAGRFHHARIQYLNVLRREENNVVALAKLLSLRDDTPDETLVSHAHRLLGRTSLEEQDQMRLHIGLGQYYDRAGLYDEAFRHFDAGYRIQFARGPFDSKAFSKAIDSLIDIFTPAFFASLARQPLESSRPIFIVGMPRSGTTLTEQILASHSQVAAGGELSTIMTIGSQIQYLGKDYRAYPAGLSDLSSADLAGMAKRYLERLDRVSAVAAKVTDKLPFNYMHLGLIAVLFPQARIIHCRRAPLDTCLSCYLVSFADEFQFANNLETLAHYYLDYTRLMDHWRKVLPVPILDVQYEALVADTERVSKAILHHCGLAWEEGCLRFHDTKRGIRTPSRWQVRQPVYSTAIGRWKNYEKHLQPLKEILDPPAAAEPDR